jgi:hypothetical protein
MPSSTRKVGQRTSIHPRRFAHPISAHRCSARAGRDPSPLLPPILLDSLWAAHLLAYVCQEGVNSRARASPRCRSRHGSTCAERHAPFVAVRRNRLKACEIAGIEPSFETRDFEDDEAVRAFVKSTNERRDLTKGQRAMQLAMLYPEVDKGGGGHKGKVTETSGFSRQRFGQARQVFSHSRELAEAVRDGTTSLDEALAVVKEQREGLKYPKRRARAQHLQRRRLSPWQREHRVRNLLGR